MSNENTVASPTEGAPQSAPAPLFQLQRIYLKDASLELPNAPQIFLETGSPQVEVQMDVSHEKLSETNTEVLVRVTVTARLGDKVMFLVEAKQAGIFDLRIPEEQLGPILGIVCPTIIYPYLRSNVADLLSRSSLPPVHLSEINFEMVYQQRLLIEAQQAAAAAGSVQAPGTDTPQ
jgi:preprotein translocase subunit SecB